jgi:hypothetical protein
MPKLELHNQQLVQGQRKLPVPLAAVEVSWPKGCTRFDLQQADIRAEVTAAVEVPKNNSPLHEGAVWRLLIAREGRRCALDLLAVRLADSAEGADRFHRRHTWRFLIVGYTADPLDLFPRPPCLERDHPEGQDILDALAAFLRDELPAAEAAHFNGEGGFTLVRPD